MNQTDSSCVFEELSEWHRAILSRLLDASFPGQQELKPQVLSAHFRVIDANQSLEISPRSNTPASVARTVPVEAFATDEDGTAIQALLFTKHGMAYMLEVLRGDGEPVQRLPPASAFGIMVLGE